MRWTFDFILFKKTSQISKGEFYLFEVILNELKTLVVESRI